LKRIKKGIFLLNIPVNRFGFTIEGVVIFDRIYYDSLYDKSKNKGEKWEGLDNTKSTLIGIANFCMPLKNDIAGNDFFTILKDSCLLMK